MNILFTPSGKPGSPSHRSTKKIKISSKGSPNGKGKKENILITPCREPGSHSIKSERKV